MYDFQGTRRIVVICLPDLHSPFTLIYRLLHDLVLIWERGAVTPRFPSHGGSQVELVDHRRTI